MWLQALGGLITGVTFAFFCDLLYMPIALTIILTAFAVFAGIIFVSAFKKQEIQDNWWFYWPIPVWIKEDDYEEEEDGGIYA